MAAVVSTVDLEANKSFTRVWLDGAPVTAGPHDGNPEWSPDGRWLAFTSRRGEKKGDSTLHVMPVGGPGEVRTGCTRPDGLHDVQAAAGSVVVMSNLRGGSGRHTVWGQAIVGPRHPAAPGTGWGSVDVDDVMNVLDGALERYDFCDADRVGMLGGSYGGYIATMLAARFDDRFKAICSERAVNDLLTAEWSSDAGTLFRIEHGPDPVEDPGEYWRMSPVRFARDITVSLLIIHAEDDYRCPISQAEELWVTLKLLGRDVTFYRFPGESHELSRSGSPVHRRQRAVIILDFFAAHLEPAAG